jgi:hypothetical protein
MYKTVLLALLMLFDSESRASADALLASGAARGAPGFAGRGRGARPASQRTKSGLGAALVPASPEAKGYTKSELVLIGASLVALLAVVVLIVVASRG